MEFISRVYQCKLSLTRDDLLVLGQDVIVTSISSRRVLHNRHWHKIPHLIHYITIELQLVGCSWIACILSPLSLDISSTLDLIGNDTILFAGNLPVSGLHQSRTILLERALQRNLG